MLLAIDVGNTQSVLGIYDGDRLVHMWRLATNVDHTSDELRIKLHALMLAEGLDESAIDGAVLASVVPAVTHNWEKVCMRSFGVEVYVVSACTCGCMLNFDPRRRFSELGADRVADAIAAKSIYGSPVIVVDFGTATNMEVIDKDERFAGESSLRASPRPCNPSSPIPPCFPPSSSRIREWRSGRTAPTPSRSASCAARPLAWTA